jgi:exonuclease SbcC
MQPLAAAYGETLAAISAEISGYETEITANYQGNLQQKNDALSAAKHIQTQLQAAQTAAQINANEYKNLQTQITNENKALTQKNDALAQTIEGLRQYEMLQYDGEKHKNLMDRVAGFRVRYHELKHIEQRLNAELPQKKTEAITLNDRIKNGNNALKNIVLELENIGYVEQKHNDLKGKITAKESEEKETQQQLYRDKINAQRIDNEINTTKKDLENNQKTEATIHKNKDNIALLEQTSNLVKEFKNDILGRISPMIGAVATELFAAITQGKYEEIKVTNDFNFEVLDKGKYYGIERFSGGEIDLANLCLRIALTKAIDGLRGGGQLMGFLAFDEIFGSQDDSRREEILAAFDRLKEQFRQIYIISHIDFVKQYFPNILEISLNEKGSSAAWLE